MDDAAEDRKLENINQPGKAGQRDDGLQNGLVPNRQSNGYIDQPRPPQRHHVSAMEQMVVNWHQLNGEMQRNGELPSWNGQESRENERRTTPKRSANGGSPGDRRADGRTMKRRTPSEGDEDMTPGMWQQFTRGGATSGTNMSNNSLGNSVSNGVGNNSLGNVRPWGAGGAAGMRLPRQRRSHRQDGMDGYFNDNVHLLEHLDNHPHNIPNGVGNEDEGIDRAMMQSDESEDDAFENDNENEMQVLMVKKLSTSSEDLGDFIETDISLPNQGSSSYANSLNSSTEDLNRVENGRCDDKENHSEAERRRPVSLFAPGITPNNFANISNLPLQQRKNDGSGSALNSDSSSSNYFSPEGDVEDFDMESNPSHVDPDSVRNSTECLHDKGNNNGAIGAACNQLECSKHWKMTEKNLCAVKLIKDSRTDRLTDRPQVDQFDSCNMEAAMLDLGLQDSRGRDDLCDDEYGAVGGESSCVNNLDYDRARVANLTARQPYNLSRHTSTSNCETDENSTQDDMEMNQLSSPNSENNDSDVYDSFVSNVNADSFAHFRDCLEPCPATGSKCGPKMWANRPSFHRRFEENEQGLNIGAHSHANLTSQSSTSDDDSPGVPAKPPPFSDDDSPSSALRLLDYEFLDSGNNLPVWTRHQHNTDDSSPDAENCASCQKNATLKRLEKDVELKARNVGQGHDLVAAAAELNVDITGIPGLDRSMMNMLAAAEGRNLQDRLMEQCSHNGDHRRIQSDEDKAMIWCEYQAFLLQVKQIGASACGATAIINVLKAFDMYEDPQRVMDIVKTNLRAEDAPVPEYLVSRSVAGTTAEILINSISELTGGAIQGIFFPTWPKRNFNMSKWICKWIRNGAVPLFTLNLQRGGPLPWVNGVSDNIRPDARLWQKVRDRGSEIVIPDAWHHQMCYGVGPKGVYLTNPLEVVSPSLLLEQLTSPSELLIRRQDVICRWHQDTDLGILLSQDAPEWRRMNVLGQVVNVIREEAMRTFPGCQPPVTSHIRIPAWYRAGITLFVKRGSPAYWDLTNEPGLPQEVESPSAGSEYSATDSPVETNQDLQSESNQNLSVESNRDLLSDNPEDLPVDLPVDSQASSLLDSTHPASHSSYNCATVVPPCRNDLPVIAESSDDSNSNQRTMNPDDSSIETSEERFESNESNQPIELNLTSKSNPSNPVVCSCNQNGEQSNSIPRRCVNSDDGQINIAVNAVDVSNASLETRNIHQNIRTDFNPMEGSSNSVNFYDTGQSSLGNSIATNPRENQQENCDGRLTNLHNPDHNSDQNQGLQTVAMEMNGVAMEENVVSRQMNAVAMDGNAVAMERNSTSTESNVVAMDTNNVSMVTGRQTENNITPESHGAERETERIQSNLEEPTSENSQSSQNQRGRP